MSSSTPSPPQPHYHHPWTLRSDASDEPPAKRLKTQACARCRRRKQKCDDQRPCSNCSRSEEQCFEVPVPAPANHGQVSLYIPNAQPDPLAYLADLAGLDERMTRLEEREARLFDMETRLARKEPDYRSRRDRAIQPQEECPETGMTLSRSPLAVGLLPVFSRSKDQSGLQVSELAAQPPRNIFDKRLVAESALSGISIDEPLEDALFDVYLHKIQCKLPFIRLHKLRNRDRTSTEPSTAFFVHMIASVALLIEEGHPSPVISAYRQQDFYRVAVTRYLSHVFAQADRLLHIQAYLMLAVHALYSPSSERLISIVSVTMRHCVLGQLHSSLADPSPVDSASKVTIQMRRRVFWSAYALDRAVGTMFNLPFSIPDSQITVKLFANIDDSLLDEACNKAFPADPPSLSRFTTATPALHYIYCRQIQSEIMNNTMHRDFGKHVDHHHPWRLRVLDKLDRWKTLCHRHPEISINTLTSSNWLHMLYHYSLVMLFQPTRSTVADFAGDWTVKACVQAILIFRDFRKKSHITELWMGLIAQFKCGVALLYCFYGTAPDMRTPAYDDPDVFEAVRACSITLALLAERWTEARCVRDAFDILAREIQLHEQRPSSHIDAGRFPRRMRQAASDQLMALMSQLEPIVMHQPTLQILKELATEEFPRSVPVTEDGDAPDEILGGSIGTSLTEENEDDSPSWQTAVTEELFQPFTPYYSSLELVDLDTADITIGFPGGFDL